MVLVGTGAVRLRRVPVYPWRFGPGAGLCAFLAALVASIVATLIATAAWGLDPADDLSLSAVLPVQVVGWVTQLLAVGVVLLIARRVVASREAGGPGLPRRGVICPDRRPTHALAALIGVVGLVLFWPMTLAVAALAGLASAAITGTPPEPVAHDLLRR